ncbi:MAG: OmpH family outer membrane protein [Acidobacteria bacterium]|jgi:Skp family chaperone for outer membrane proteins|nr:OmpH family outer membrane protein [Acidobacteriota bacterium]MBA3784255.1 OmpH family outer membrane protein [Acidobacteriota bacterium]
MKTFRSIAVVFIFAAIFAVSAFAQTQPAATGKVGIVNTLAFDTDKGGITKYVNAMNALEVELKPDVTALQGMATKLQTLQTEITRIQEQARTNPNVPIKPETVNPKLEEYDKLGREFKFKQEEYKAKAERRQAAVMGPVRLDIGNALQEFAKKNGYMMILDASKLDGAGLLLAFDEKYDITKDFITFYNSRPAATAAK